LANVDLVEESVFGDARFTKRLYTQNVVFIWTLKHKEFISKFC